MNGLGLKAFRWLVMGALCACLPQCGKAAVSSEHCGGLACTGSGTCTAAANIPLCADPFSGVCHSTSHQCVWKLKTTDSACPCMEHDVRLCMVGGSTPGVQICTANAGHTGTFWAACVACPGCS